LRFAPLLLADRFVVRLVAANRRTRVMANLGANFRARLVANRGLGRERDRGAVR